MRGLRLVCRRELLRAGAAAVTAGLVRRVPAVDAAERQKLRAAFIGAGGRGADNLAGLLPHVRVVAFADADERRAASTYQRHPDVPRYRDYRRMLERHAGELDVVVVSTPDHTHACAALAAIQLGKHVYCEKPLAHSVHEVRALVRASRAAKVVTQLGNQGHSAGTMRLFREWIEAGAIGRVHTVHAWCSRIHCAIPKLHVLAERMPVPEGLDWDCWLGPAAERPYHSAYLPGAWRNWFAFGCGTIGDWVCHVVDPVFWALDLGAPSTIRAVATDRFDPAVHGETFPFGSHIEFRFPAIAGRGAVVLHWYDGTIRPPRPPELEPDRELPDIGALVVGDRGSIVYGSHGAASVRLIPESAMREFQLPPQRLPRVRGGHYEDFVEAIQTGRQAGSDFGYGGPLTEIALLGIIAQRFPGRELRWNGTAGRFEEPGEANRLLKPENPRAGWPIG
ncbi:MAG: Gfo/Idh/MocA family oxidoreductase [Kiritimatiellae bacterium]|nr:Gfo/Idh/MocA family oxidoreductase [Kiritimatiellia bacterium]